jgi:hypothetical protein
MVAENRICLVTSVLIVVEIIISATNENGEVTVIVNINQGWDRG